MGRAMFILVSDDNELTESTKAFGRNHNVNVQCWSTAEWHGQIDDPNFRSQLKGQAPALTSGSSPVTTGAKILPFPAGGSSSVTSQKVQTINELESVAIENAIHEFNGNLTEAAKALGIGRATLYRKVKQYNIDPSHARKKRAA